MAAKAQFKFQVKAVEEDGTFTGVAAAYGNVDLGGDVIERGAFAKTIADRTEIPILWQHDSREPIGVGQLQDSDHGLMIKGRLVLESDVARKAYGLLKAKALRGLSIGYDVVRQAMEGSVRHLKEIKLWEVSLVTFPMNPEAQVTGVKADELNADVSALVDQVNSVCLAMKSGVHMTRDAAQGLLKAYDALAALRQAAEQQNGVLTDDDLKSVDDLREAVKAATQRLYN